MDKVSNTSNDQESHSMSLEYDINDVKLSIQEANRVIEKFAFDRGAEKDGSVGLLIISPTK